MQASPISWLFTVYYRDMSGMLYGNLTLDAVVAFLFPIRALIHRYYRLFNRDMKQNRTLHSFPYRIMRYFRRSFIFKLFKGHYFYKNKTL